VLPVVGVVMVALAATTASAAAAGLAVHLPLPLYFVHLALPLPLLLLFLFLLLLLLPSFSCPPASRRSRRRPREGTNQDPKARACIAPISFSPSVPVVV